MPRQLIAITLCAALSGGCATAGASRVGRDAPSAGWTAAQAADPALLAEYVRKLPYGARVRVALVQGGAVKGTLIKATADAIVVQRRTRIPEPPREIPLDTVAAVTLEGDGGVGKAIALGVAAGAGAALAVFAILVAIYAD